MKKFALGIGLLIVLGFIIGGIVNRCDPTTVTNEIDIEGNRIKLKYRIDTAKMETYTDKVYGVKVQYPAFFNVMDTTEAGTARFSYPDKEIVVRLSMFVEPNVEGWTIEEAVNNMTDSYTRCVAKGKDFFIMQGTTPNATVGAYLEKCFLLDNKWIDYTLFYDTHYGIALERLMALIWDWHPYRKESCIDIKE